MKKNDRPHVLPKRPFFFWILLLLPVLASCGDGSDEDPDDPCRRVDCGKGSCHAEGGQAACFCNGGYVAYGLSCVPDPCTPDPCAYGVCQVDGQRAVCRCEAGYAGEFCNQCAAGYRPVENACVPGDPCESDPCVFGVCFLSDGRTSCTCHSGYTGELCDRCAEGYHAEDLACLPDTPCSPNPCIHGQCRVEGGSSVCDCAEGYRGDRCDACAEGYELQGLSCVPAGTGDPCDPNPCLDAEFNPYENRSVCLDMGGEAACGCDPGYVWKTDACVENGGADPCDPNPCNETNRTVCKAEDDRARCLCDEGFVENPDGQCVEDLTSIPTRICGAWVRYRSNSVGPVYIRGEFNAWGLSHPLEKTDGVWEILMDDLPPGDYAYKLYDDADGSWFLDPNNRYTKYTEGTANSRLRVPDCDEPLLTLDAAPESDSGRISFTVSAVYGQGRFPLLVENARVSRNGEPLADSGFDPQTGVFTIDQNGLADGKYSYLFELEDSEGNAARPLFVPVWVEDSPFDWRDATLYFVMTDRFLDGDGSNNAPVSDSQLDGKANWQGGDFEGIRQKIADGYFRDLGVNAIWISSPVMNTQGAFWGSDGHKYSGYHSYWPISTGWTDENELPGVQPVDPHFGTLEEFKNLVRLAHENGIRVVVDFVANHVHRDSPVYDARWQEADPWFHWDNGNMGSGYVCGWEQPIACWFAEYLPDFEYKNPAVMKMVMDHAIWLIRETNIDGFRLDAVKHMILDFSTTVRARIDEEIDTHDGIRFYMVGETFTGDNGQDEIRPFVGRELLDGQFDFPMFWAALKALVRHEMGLGDLKNFMDGNDGTYGSDAIMSTFLGNHDVPRALSHADGSIGDVWGNGSKEQGWTNPPGDPGYDSPYQRLRMAWTFLFTQAGVPMIYYGDEIGLPGAGDPDNRRMMRFGSDLLSRQQATLAHVEKLGTARAAHPALRTGTRSTKKAESDYWAYTMKKSADAALVILNRGGSRTDSLNVSGVFENGRKLKDALGGTEVTVSGGAVSVSMAALSSAVYVPAN